MLVGEFAALGCAFASAITIALFTHLSGKIGVFTLTLFRLLLGMIFIGLIHYLSTGVFLEAYSDRTQLYYLIASGVIGFSIGDLFLFRSSVMLGPRLGVLIFVTYVPMATLMAMPLLGERPGFYATVGMAATLVGIAIVVMTRRSHGKDASEFIPKNLPVGVVLGLCGAFCQALALVLSKMAMEGNDTTAMNALFVRLLAAVVAIWVGGFILRRSQRAIKTFLGWKTLGWTAVGAFMGPVVSVWLSLIAVRYTYTGVATTIMALTPITIIPIAQLTHREKITPWIIFGTLVAIAGVALLFVK